LAHLYYVLVFISFRTYNSEFFRNLFVELEDDSEEVPTLKGKSYDDFCLDHKDWEKLKQMKEVLQVHKTFHYHFDIE